MIATGTVINMLSTMGNESSDWPNGLWKVQQFINTTVQKSTGFSPLRLQIAVEANIPNISARLNDVLDSSNIEPCINV